MFLNPLLQTNVHLGVPAGITSVPRTVKHKRTASTTNINTPAVIGGLPVQAPQFSLNPYTYDANSNYDGSSRSTSTYSIMPDSAAPLLNGCALVPAYPGTHADMDRKSHPFSFRLPSDQLEKLIQGIKPQTQQLQPGTISGTTMLPPPLPPHAAAAKDSLLQDRDGTFVSATADLPFGSDVVHFTDRRDESRYSDISMHAGCTSFPTCTTEDAEGHIVHDINTNGNGTPSAPATVVRGRKEGSSPTKRKLSRSAKKDDVEEKAKKRPRRSTRLLQHDSGYDAGSSGNSDERNGDIDTGVEGTGNGNGTAVIKPGGHAGEEAD